MDNFDPNCIQTSQKTPPTSILKSMQKTFLNWPFKVCVGGLIAAFLAESFADPKESRRRYKEKEAQKIPFVKRKPSRHGTQENRNPEKNLWALYPYQAQNAHKKILDLCLCHKL